MTWLMLFCHCVMLLIAGYALPFWKSKRLSRIVGWALAVLTVVGSTLVTWEQPPLLRMIIIVFLQLLSMKVIVMVETYSGENRLSIFQWIAFATSWFGMRPVLFEKLPSASLDYVTLVLKGVSRIVIGMAFLYLSEQCEQYSWLPKLFIPQLVMLAGLSLILHFGILNLATAVWRWCGVDVSELFRAPYRAKSLKEFWGKRWNLAFSEMTALIAYRPLKTKIGIQPAIILSFLLSGLLHEIAISFPVRAGYGLPMIYFAIHAIAMQLEARSKFIQAITSHRIFSHVWVMAILILPMPLLFHKDFIQQVLVPLRTLLLYFI